MKYFLKNLPYLYTLSKSRNILSKKAAFQGWIFIIIIRNVLSGILNEFVFFYNTTQKFQFHLGLLFLLRFSF